MSEVPPPIPPPPAAPPPQVPPPHAPPPHNPYAGWAAPPPPPATRGPRIVILVVAFLVIISVAGVAGIVVWASKQANKVITKPVNAGKPRTVREIEGGWVEARFEEFPLNLELPGAPTELPYNPNDLGADTKMIMDQFVAYQAVGESVNAQVFGFWMTLIGMASISEGEIKDFAKAYSEDRADTKIIDLPGLPKEILATHYRSKESGTEMDTINLFRPHFKWAPHRQRGCPHRIRSPRSRDADWEVDSASLGCRGRNREPGTANREPWGTSAWRSVSGRRKIAEMRSGRFAVRDSRFAKVPSGSRFPRHPKPEPRPPIPPPGSRFAVPGSRFPPYPPTPNLPITRMFGFSLAW